MPKIEIDKEKCIHCGMCINDCISMCLEFDEEKIPQMKHENRCLNCQHCLAICPSGALKFDGKSGCQINEQDNNILNLIKSRRSIRQFKEDEIDEETWTKLKDMLPYIPTGCNSHKLHFSIVQKREVMRELKEKVNTKLIKALNNNILAPAVKHFEVYKKAFERGDDIIFRSAPHMVVVSSPINAPCAPQDGVIALSYLELYANSLGLGTCWCGYGEICVKIFPEICDILEIPEGYTPIYTMLIGYPAVKYQRIPEPEPYSISEINDTEKKSTSCIFCKAKRFITNFIR